MIFSSSSIRFVTQVIIAIISCAGAEIVMAPEVLFNFAGRSYDVKSDCWSLGVILYQLLCGNLPVTDDSDEENFSITAQMGNGRWTEISSNAKDLVEKLVEVDPVMRLTADQALNHVWFQGDPEVCSMARTIMFDSGDLAMPQAVAQRQLRPRKFVNYKL